MSEEGRTSVFITGATRGIGRATAEYFRSRGFAVAATGRDLSSIEHLQDENFLAIECDVTDESSVMRAVERAREALGPIATVVNNAGFGIPAPVDAISTAELVELFDVNVFGAHRVVRATLGDMRALGKGRIVNVSSAAGRIVTPNLGAYCASKYALEALSDAMRLELRDFGISVCLVEPGPIATSFGERSRRELERVTRRLREEDPERADAVGRYQEGSSSALDLFRKDAESVARVIFRAATEARPKARYRVTLPAWAAEVGRLLPTRIADAAMGRFARRAAHPKSPGAS